MTADAEWVEVWIDTLAKVWEISDGKSGTVKSYRVFERDEFPEDVPLDKATALSFIDNADIQYSQGGPCTVIWHGSTEFNLAPNLSRKHIPRILRYFKRIVVAAAANMKLSGKVSYFALEPQNSISLEPLQYGQQARHLGLVVRWTVKQVIAGLVVGDPTLP